MERLYRYNDLIAELLQFKELNTNISHEVIGYSVLGKEIVAFKVGCGEREVHYNASIHANEWITALILTKFIQDCLAGLDEVSNSLPGIKRLLNENSIWLVPLLNPDGVELVLDGIKEKNVHKQQLLEWNNRSEDFSGWKANINGVDLNDQFPAYWKEEQLRRGLAKPGPMNYSGDGPLSEPEASAIAKFTLEHNFALVVALHTQGEEIYWNYRGYEPNEAEAIAHKFALASGYNAVKITDSDAGYKDWFIQHFGRPGFTIEAGLGKNPLPLSQFGDMYQSVSKILLLALKI